MLVSLTMESNIELYRIALIVGEEMITIKNQM